MSLINRHILFSAFFLLAPCVFAQDADEIIVKSTNAVMFQITANMKLTQDQISAIRPVVTNNIVKVRDLQLSLQKGDIDSKAMYDQRAQLNQEENQELSHIFTPDQMKLWTNMQDQ